MNKLITLLIFFVIVISMMALTNDSVIDKTNVNNDSLNAAKQVYVDEILVTIAGKEKMPSDSVFKDVQMLKGMPAEKLLGIMNKGFSTALGVGCDYCHNTQDFASNEIPAKRIAREMMTMSGQIADMLHNIKDIKTENAHVNCTTCHRGSIVPATKMN